MKLTKKELRKKAQETKNLIKGIVNETIDIPDNAIILDTSILIQIFTKKRIELIQFINKFKPQSVQELADLTHRKKQAVDRDLKMLERYELLVMEKNGRKTMPRVQRKFLIMGLTDIYPLETSKKLAENNIQRLSSQEVTV